MLAAWYDGVPVAESGSLPQDLTVAGNMAFFTADDGAHGRELWKTDGTTAGTQLVKDIRPGSGGIGSPQIIATGDGSVMFVIAAPGSNDSQLWVSDGTDAGTQRVMSTSANAIASLGFANGIRYFDITTNDSNATPGLWRTDGTAGGTNLVRPMDSADHFVALNGMTYFFGSGPGGTSLWKTDGTNPGTALITPVGDLDGEPVVLDNAVYFFSAGDNGPSLWQIDSAGNTHLIQTLAVKDVNQPAVVGDEFFFGALEQDNSFSLWHSDGTDAGTRKIAALPAAAPNIVELGGSAYFAMNIPDSGAELWHSDGTPAGTSKLKSLAPAGQFVSTRDLAAIGNAVYFTVPFGAGGVELWKTTGSVASTRRVVVLNPTAGDVSNSPPTTLGNTLLFDAFTPTTGWELNTSSGVLANINTEHAAFSPSARMRFARKTYVFTANDGFSGRELWITDNTIAGTKLIKDIWPGERDAEIEQVTVVGSSVYFVANDSQHGRELWRSDGTAAGTQMVADRAPGLASSNITGVFNVNGVAHFSDSGTLYRIDPATQKIDSVSSIASASPVAQPSLNGNWYFLSDLQTVSKTRGDGNVKTAFAATQQMDQASLDVNDGNIVYTGRIHRVAPAPPNQKLVRIIAPSTQPIVSSPGGPVPFATLRSDVLRVFGTEGDDSIGLALDSADPTLLDVSFNGQSGSFPLANLRLIIVYGDSGDDAIQFDAARGQVRIATKLYGSLGDDTIVGAGTRDRIYGGDGADSIDGNAGNDIIYAEAGDDTIIGSIGNDYISGGEGVDSIQGNKGHDRIFTEMSIDILLTDRFDSIAIDGGAV